MGSRDRELNNANQRISGLHKELEECRTKVVPIETVVKTARVPESIITFRQGRSSVDASQLPNVERVASYMKKYPDSKVIIKGTLLQKAMLRSTQKLLPHVQKL